MKRSQEKMEQKLLEQKLCQHCDRIVKGAEMVCLECGRLLTGNLREISWAELLEAEPEYKQNPCEPKVRVLFALAAEKHETDLPCEI